MTHHNTEQPPDGLLTCPFCYKWLGDHHRKEDCPRSQPADTSLEDIIQLFQDHGGFDEQVEDRYYETFSPMHLIHELLAWHTTQQKALLKRVREEVSTNQKGQFEDNGGNVCWYLDDLLQALDNLMEEMR